MPSGDSPRPADPKSDDTRKRAVNSARGYAVYSGMAIQMIVILLIGTYGGKYLDQYFQTETPWFTIVCVLLALVLALYVPLRSLMR